MNSNSSRPNFSRFASDRVQQAQEDLSLRTKAFSNEELQVGLVVQVRDSNTRELRTYGCREVSVYVTFTCNFLQLTLNSTKEEIPTLTNPTS
jgi:hypothetical protein